MFSSRAAMLFCFNKPLLLLLLLLVLESLEAPVFAIKGAVEFGGGDLLLECGGGRWMSMCL